MSPAKRAFYEYHAALMEPWDGPASIAFTDGSVVGAVLDRNGLRPSRYYVTKDGVVVMASEVGVLGDEIHLRTLPTRRACSPAVCSGWHGPGPHHQRRRNQGNDGRRLSLPGGWTRIWSNWMPCARRLISTRQTTMPACCTASMSSATPLRRSAPCWRRWPRMAWRHWGAWATTPIAVLSDRPQLLYTYFRQLFAQVTNPPLDAIREELVTASDVMMGTEGNLLETVPENCRQIRLKNPIFNQRAIGQARPYQGAQLQVTEAAHAFPG